MSQIPTPLGLKRSFGFGDRLGLATPGHAASARKFDFAPVFAQQSIHELVCTERTPSEVIAAAVGALDSIGYNGPWGADADHLRTPDDVVYTASAGFTSFTIDPSEFVNNDAEDMQVHELEMAASRLSPSIFPSSDWWNEYTDKTFDVHESFSLTVHKEELLRSAVKYGRAVAHCETMAQSVARACEDRPFEIEVSVDASDSPTSPVDHLFLALELRKRGVKLTAFAPHFIGKFENGVDFEGDLEGLERSLIQHVAIANHCGPYKISIHSGSDKFAAYPIIGRICGDRLHVKTGGTSYLEALRVVLRTEPALFNEIKRFCVERFAADKKRESVSTSEEDAVEAAARADVEQAMLEEGAGRQLLLVTFGSVLTSGKTACGRSFKSAIVETLDRHLDLYFELLEKHFDRHLSLLSKG